MSFYGNVFYSYSNAFKYQKFENTPPIDLEHSGDTSPISSESSEYREYTIAPTGRSDTSILKAGNKWIRFAQVGQDNANRTVQIYHRTAMVDSDLALQDDQNSNGFYTRLNPTAIDGQNISGDVELQFGNVLTIPQITFDKAGHIVNSTMKRIHIPVPEGTEDINAIKLRLATLEEMLTGDHYDAGHNNQGQDNTVPEYDNGVDYTSVLNDINNKIQHWQLRLQSDNTLEGLYKEEAGIGDTLHELMVTIGTRVKGTYETTENGQTVRKEGYRAVIPQDDISNSILGRMAIMSMMSTYAVDNRSKINEIIEYICVIIAGCSQDETTWPIRKLTTINT